MVVENCPAKVNLFLDVLGRRRDGYHEILTVMAPVSLWDTIEVRPGRSRDVLAVHPSGAAPPGGKNSVLKALIALRRLRPVPPLRIRLHKRIPSGAGLGGGSSDAAGLVRAVNKCLKMRMSPSEQEAVLARVGSDTAFFVRGVTALCTGRGERVHPLARPPRLSLVLYCPPFSNPTREVYRRVRLPKSRSRPTAADFLMGWTASHPAKVGRLLFNRLESAALDYRPSLRNVRNELLAYPFVAVRMTGSGSGFYAVCRNARESRTFAAALARRCEGLVLAVQTV